MRKRERERERERVRKRERGCEREKAKTNIRNLATIENFQKTELLKGQCHDIQ